MKAICPCGFEANVKFVGMSIDQPSGWVRVPGFDGSIINLCPACGIEARELARGIVELCGTSNIYLPALSKDNKQEPEPSDSPDLQ